jgi:hypothetical protein
VQRCAAVNPVCRAVPSATTLTHHHRPVLDGPRARIAAARLRCYANVMRTQRITISVPAEVARRVKRAVGNASVSAWVTGLIEERLEDRDLERLWREFYRSVRPRGEDVRRANTMFRRLTKPRRKTAA